MDSERAGDFGARMKRLREERGVSLRNIAETTKISFSALEALERNDISRLPGGIFSRAFVRAYAVEIGADPEEIVREFISRFPHESVIVGSSHARHPSTPLAVTVSLPKGHSVEGPVRVDAGRRAAVVAAIVLPLAAILVWSLLSQQ
jgi:cytoskeletal protein RodZ